MGKRKRLHIISISEVQQRLSEVEHPSEKNLSASNPTEASSSQVSHPQHPSHQMHVATSSEATNDSAPLDSGD
ncbi:hypothetical protein Tco_0086691 [Tanacetum coccineum]